MNVNVSYADDSDFDSLLYGIPHPNTVRSIQQELYDIQNNLQSTYGLSDGFVNRLMTNFMNFGSDAAIQKAKIAVYNQTGQTLHQVQLYTSIAEMQTAAPNMQRWIMACPDVRQLYHSNQLDGYSDTYVDYEPGKVGEDHYDYRRVMDGVVVFDEETDGWYSDSYLDEITDPDMDTLDFTEQLNIIRTWENMRVLLRDHPEDPTSPYGGSR